MKSICIKSIVIVIIFSCINVKVIGQNITVTLEVLSNVIHNIEPLFYQVQVQNNSETVQESDIPFGSCRTLEMYNKTSKKWIILEDSEKTNQLRFNPTANQGFRSGIKPRKYYIKPQQEFINQFVYFPFKGNFYDSFEYLFRENDTVKIRVACEFDKNSGEKIISNEIQIIIKSNDINEVQYLEKKQTPHFLYETIILQSFVGHFFPKESVSYPLEARYFLENYPNSKYAAWADTHLAWNNYLVAEKNQLEAKYGLAQDSIQAVNEAKTLIIQAERHLESALESEDILVKPYAKQLYYSVVNMKMTLRLYATLEEYLKATEYIDSF